MLFHDAQYLLKEKYPVIMASDKNLNFNRSLVFHAASNGRLDQLKIFLNDRPKKDIEDFVSTLTNGKTPLIAACQEGHVDVVSYLLEKCQADVEQVGCVKRDGDIIEGATPLLCAAAFNQLNIIKTLIKHNADVNAKAKAGSIPLRAAISPLLAAADYGNVSVVEYLLKKISFTKREKIDALELLGSFFIDKKPDMLAALRFWKRAVAMRFEDKEFFIEDSYQKSRLALYLDISEIRMPEEAELANTNHEKMNLLALLIRERVLGPYHPGTIYYIRIRGTKFVDEGNFQRCIQLWKYALDLQQEHEKPLSLATLNSLKGFTLLFIFMMNTAPEKSVTVFNEILNVFKKTVLEIENSFNLSKSRERIPPKDVNRPIGLAMRFIGLMCGLMPSLNQSEQLAFKKEIYNYVQLNPVTYKIKTPLHLACSKNREHDQNQQVTYASKEVVELLLEVGASPNAVDHKGNSPLHLAAKSKPFRISIFQILLNHGAHLDASNYENETPLTLADPSDISGINPLQYVSLQCLSAKAIHFFQIPYEEFISGALLKFLNLHK